MHADCILIACRRYIVEWDPSDRAVDNETVTVVCNNTEVSMATRGGAGRSRGRGEWGKGGVRSIQFPDAPKSGTTIK